MEITLWREFTSYFPIGAAVNPPVLHSHDQLLKRHFNSITNQLPSPYRANAPLLFDKDHCPSRPSNAF